MAEFMVAESVVVKTSHMSADKTQNTQTRAGSRGSLPPEIHVCQVVLYPEVSTPSQNSTTLWELHAQMYER